MQQRGRKSSIPPKAVLRILELKNTHSPKAISKMLKEEGIAEVGPSSIWRFCEAQKEYRTDTVLERRVEIQQRIVDGVSDHAVADLRAFSESAAEIDRLANLMVELAAETPDLRFLMDRREGKPKPILGDDGHLIPLTPREINVELMIRGLKLKAYASAVQARGTSATIRFGTFKIVGLETAAMEAFRQRVSGAFEDAVRSGRIGEGEARELWDALKASPDV